MGAREDIALFMKRAYDRGLTTATGGNISVREGSVMLITPSGKDKGSLSADDIAEVDMPTGENLTPDRKLSIETGMHRAVYLARPDVMAIVHCHPLYSCLFAASEERVNTALVAEDFLLLDEVVKVPYALMGTEELAMAVAAYAPEHDALLLENHGAIAFGRTLLSAFDRLECLEQAAHITYLSHEVAARGINKQERDRIVQMR